MKAKLLSVIIPAYNEEKRLSVFLQDVFDFVQKKKYYEIILVNDGSTDNTLSIMQKMKGNATNVHIVTYLDNRGKCGAVKAGVEFAKGDDIIFIDADGSIHPREIPMMAEKLASFDVVVGNRASKESDVVQPFLRQLTGRIFNSYVNFLFGTTIQDHLCGFKGFKRNVAKTLFSDLKSKGWIFDVELFYKIHKNNNSLYLLPIHWEHKENTKIKIFDPIRMAVQLLVLRLRL